jgi:hypothetical protein
MHANVRETINYLRPAVGACHNLPKQWSYAPSNPGCFECLRSSRTSALCQRQAVSRQDEGMRPA